MAIRPGSELVNIRHSLKRHGLDLDPSAQYSTTPAMNKSLLLSAPISLRAPALMCSVVAMRRARKDAARLTLGARLRSVRTWRCSSVRYTSRNHNERELFDTP